MSDYSFKNLKPSDVYFYGQMFEDDLDDPVFTMCPKVFWDKYKHMYDGHLFDLIEHILPPGDFEEMMESEFAYDGTLEEGRQALLDAGFIENPAMGLPLSIDIEEDDLHFNENGDSDEDFRNEYEDIEL